MKGFVTAVLFVGGAGLIPAVLFVFVGRVVFWLAGAPIGPGEGAQLLACGAALAADEAAAVGVASSSSPPQEAAKSRVAGSAATRNRRGSMLRVILGR